MRRVILAVAIVSLGSVGCFLPTSPSDPNERVDALLVSSETIGQIADSQNGWNQFWFGDQPEHMTYDRIHGGIE
jgi:hypothetical protein